MIYYHPNIIASSAFYSKSRCSMQFALLQTIKSSSPKLFSQIANNIEVDGTVLLLLLFCLKNVMENEWSNVWARRKDNPRSDWKLFEIDRVDFLLCYIQCTFYPP